MYYLEQLAVLCKTHPIQHKIIFVPSLQAGYNITTALAASGQSWLNLHLITPIEWMRQKIVPRLQAEGWKPLLPDYDLFFMEEMVENLWEEEGDDYFAGQLDAADLAKPFLRAFQDLRNAGIRPEDLEKKGLDSSKIQSIIPLYRAYRDLLQEKQYYDDAFVCECAIEQLSQEQETPGTIYAIFDEVALTELAYRYIEKQVGEGLYRIGRDDYGMYAPEQSAAVRFRNAPFPSTENMRVGAGGQSLSGKLSARDAEDLNLVQVLGTEGETRFAIRDILQHEYPLDTVEIACSNDVPYLSHLYDLSERFDIPMTFAGGLPPELTRPGQALIGFLRWIASSFDAAELVDLCQAGLISFVKGKSGSAEQTPEPHEVAALLRRGRIRKGRASYRAGFDRVERELLGQIEQNREHNRSTDRLERQREHLQTVRQLVDGLFELLPAGDRTSVQGLTQACLQFLGGYAPVRAGYDTSAVVALTVHMRNLGESVESEGPLLRLAQYLIDMLARHRVESLGARPGHIYVVPLQRAGYTGRKNLYILGLDEGSFPGRGIEDPILLDDERIQLSSGLLQHRRRPGEKVWQLVRALGMAPGRVALVTRRRGLADGSECYPSAFFQQLADQLKKEDEEERPIVPFLPSPDDLSLDETEAMLTVRHSAGFKEVAEQDFPWLVTGREAVQKRAHPALTRFDGWLGRETPELNPARGDMPMSVSRLECLVRCPFRYFLQHVLRVEPLEEFVEDPTCWLSPLDFGKLLHVLLCDFMKVLQERKERPDREKHADLLREKLEEKVEEYRQLIPVQHEAAFQADKQRLDKSTQIFLAAESIQENVEAIGFEVSFGFGKKDGLNCPDPVLLRLTDRVQILLRGYIDRVDRVEKNFCIWDYKTGSASHYTEESLLGAGSYLQWALYAYALNETLRREKEKGRVARSGYFFISDRGYGQRVAPELPAPGEIGMKLEPLFDLVANGCFFPIQKQDQCTYCDYRGACDGDPIQKKHIPGVKEAMPEQAHITEFIERWIHG